MIPRAEYHRAIVELSGRSEYTLYSNILDIYRSALTKAGFLRHNSRGKYSRVKKIPKDLSWDACRQMAYPGCLTGVKKSKYVDGRQFAGYSIVDF